MNQLTGVTDNTSSGLQSRTTYVYDAIGQRIEEDVWTPSGLTVIRNAYSDGQVFADLTSSNTLQTRYLWGDEANQIIASITSGGAASWMLTDVRGSVRNVVNASGSVTATVVYDGYGNITSESGTPGLYLYAGLRQDGTGYHGDGFLNRSEYEPTIGEFDSPDPAQQGGNWYRYVGNDPTNRMDPTGLAPQSNWQPTATEYEIKYKELSRSLKVTIYPDGSFEVSLLVTFNIFQRTRTIETNKGLEDLKAQIAKSVRTK